MGLVIWAYFRDLKMSAAALVALAHDLVLTIGIYALVGFTVTPATLIGILTILGYSLYDTVVVFDKVRENVRDIKSSTTRTYSEAANLGVNQVLVRSINTTVIGVLPVAALLFAGAVILGEGPLKDLALALFVGMVSGAYSSIFIATPLLAQLREREPDMKKLASRVAVAAVQGGPASPAGRTRPPERRRSSSRCRRRTGPRPTRRPKPSGRGEPSDEELAEAMLSSRTGVKISRVSSAERPDIRPLSEGAAKRPAAAAQVPQPAKEVGRWHWR